MKIDTSLIEIANSAIREARIVNDNGLYDKVFRGYISSFGASIVQAGLIPTIIFFEADSAQAKDRPKVVKALQLMLDEEYRVESLAKYLLEKKEEMGEKLFINEEKHLLKNMTVAMVAIKLALRMYKEKDKKENDNG